MGIIDDMVVNVKSAAEAVGKTTGKLVDLSKLKVAAAELNAEVVERYEALGQYVYNNCRALLGTDVEAAGKMAEIEEMQAQLGVINKEILTKQNKKVCPTCGHQALLENVYCSVCGTKLPEEECPVQEAAPEAPVTPETPDTAEASEEPKDENPQQ